MATFPHNQVQWLVNEIAKRISLAHLYQVSMTCAVAGGAWLSWVLVRRLRSHAASRIIAVYWLITLVGIGCTWRMLTANNVELVHYPQYLPEGMALFALTLSPVESLSWIAIFGILDEGYQYAVLSSARAVPFDFNDVFMDVLGGAAGILLAMAFLPSVPRPAGSPPAKRLWRRTGLVALLAIVATGIGLWSTGRMRLYADKSDPNYWFAVSRFSAPAFWFRVVDNGPNRYHTLSPIEGPILILAAIGLYAIIDRRVQILKL